MDGGRGRAHGLPPPYGHGGREPARDRSADGPYRTGCGPAARYRPSRLPPRGDAGVEWKRVERRHAPRVLDVHCQDIRPEVLRRARQQDLSFLAAILEGVFTVPGDGFIDYYAFARSLAACGYRGWVVVEAE